MDNQANDPDKFDNAKKEAIEKKMRSILHANYKSKQYLELAEDCDYNAAEGKRNIWLKIPSITL